MQKPPPEFARVVEKMLNTPPNPKKAVAKRADSKSPARRPQKPRADASDASD